MRPKILVSENKANGELIPGDLIISEDYNHYLIKLAVDENQAYSKEKVEYVYYQLATQIGIEMMPSKLIADKHFATLRFDRQHGKKQHILTASGMTGWDFQKPDNSSYDNLFKLALDLKLPHKDIQQLFKRMVFNLVFANIDDHLKNFSCLNFLICSSIKNTTLTPSSCQTKKMLRLHKNSLQRTQYVSLRDDIGRIRNFDHYLVQQHEG